MGYGESRLSPPCVEEFPRRFLGTDPLDRGALIIRPIQVLTHQTVGIAFWNKRSGHKAKRCCFSSATLQVFPLSLSKAKPCQ